MKWLGIGALIALALVGIIWFGTHSGLVNKDQAVEESIANVQVDLQRQSNLIPALIRNAEASGRFERSTLNDVIRARAGAGGIAQTSPSDIADNPELQRQLFEQQQNMSGALGRLLVVFERYPDLQTTALYRGLQDELAGSQNRIAYSRAQWNRANRDYNVAIRTFPGNVIGPISGFGERDYYEAQADVTEMPELNYSDAPATP